MLRLELAWTPVEKQAGKLAAHSYGPAYEGLFGDAARYFAALPEFSALAQNCRKKALHANG